MKKTVLVCALLGLAASAAFSPALADPWGPHHHRLDYGYERDWYPWRHEHHFHDPFFWGPLNTWRAGRWFFGYHEGYSGWWWVVGNAWYLYGARAEGYPDVYTQPMVVVGAGQAPIVYQTVTSPSAVVMTAPATTTITTTTSAAPAAAATASGTIVKFNDAAPATIEASQASSTFIDKNGRTCREYKTSITVDGKQQPAKGTACLESDGSWRVVK